ncbi:Acg family FMN-binding oxidoreductase [Mycolicibacterium komossense]|uniref:Nitroreductase family protein n=1 Tax=Mycolicibacterium komossense TaxID=1779 RepID=A0ABT3CCV9_9MYCO|nr:NAD(P)H nitroreductase [Mycolicibacterium komossense]MCV7227303.1 nitroreductase family protein [Mycolicibacterium komossense]
MPQHLVETDVIRSAIGLASRAPSLHNTQPWQWVTDGVELQLYLARGRIVRHTDAAGREALISCGAMLDHVRVAMAAAGRRTTVERFPNPDNPEHLATLTFSPLDYPADSVQLIADAIVLRRTDRLPFHAPVDFGRVESVLRRALATTRVRLDVLVDKERQDLVEASRVSEAARRFDTNYGADLDWWTAPFGLDSGIPRTALPSVPEADRVNINRHFPVGPSGDRRAAITHDESTVLVLSTPDDSRAAALECGEALSQVLLECTLAGLATCTITHLTEDPSARKVLAGLIRHAGVPQLLIRVGRVPTLEQGAPVTPRRTVDDILWVRF